MGKDPTQCVHFHPISLLNMDLKLFTKILTNWLFPFVQWIIYNDQVGFIPNRKVKDNTTRVLNIIHKAHISAISTILLSTDAWKAFDCVDWILMKVVMQHLKICSKFRLWVINYIFSEHFTLQNETCQVCPLSPPIFISTLEPLLCHIRENPNISGMLSDKEAHRVAGYARSFIFHYESSDLFAKPPARALWLWRILQFQVKFTNTWSPQYQHSHTLKGIKSHFPFDWSAYHITYLGIHLTSHAKDIFCEIFPPLLSHLK